MYFSASYFLLAVCALLLIVIAYLQFRLHGRLSRVQEQTQHQHEKIEQQFHRLVASSDERYKIISELRDTFLRLLDEQKERQYKQQAKFDEHQLNNLKLLQDSLQNSMADVRKQLTQTLTYNAERLDKQIYKLTQQVDYHLKLISGQVEKRLTEGFDKTTALFTDVVKRLALIDQAQAKITQLSSHVVNLKEILVDKRSRGVFGEIQLNNLIRNILPAKHFAFQHTLSNGKRVDCLLFLPSPTGNIAIDAKFPLESYQILTNPELPESTRKAAERQFQFDIRKHIHDIASKYIIPNETADGAMMFIPAEAIFAEIHAHYPGLVEEAQRAKVWLVSPTTMMAILTTASAVLKDVATRKQLHIIQEHLASLGQDFNRFQTRMNNLARHIAQANADVEQVHRSSRKISDRFEKIEKVDLSVKLEES